jgi:hypothetical protein
MAHNTVKDTYRQLGKKIDSLPERVPWNETLYEILKELYTPVSPRWAARCKTIADLRAVHTDSTRSGRHSRIDRRPITGTRDRHTIWAKDA